MEKYSDEENLTTASVSEPDPSRYYTAREYQQWTYEGLYELIHGKAYKMGPPSPNTNHQSSVISLGSSFFHHFKNEKCTVFVSPFDVYLVKPGEDYKQCRNILEPDVCIICDPDKIKDFGCVGAPDLVVEILSPSTAKRDLKLKYELYEEYGVKE